MHGAGNEAWARMVMDVFNYESIQYSEIEKINFMVLMVEDSVLEAPNYKYYKY